MKVYLLILGIGVFLAGLIIGAVIVALNLSQQFSFGLLLPKLIDFNSFAGVLLASISIIFTFFGVFVAVLAFFGFASISDRVEQVAKNQIEDSAENGLLRNITTDFATNTATEVSDSVAARVAFETVELALAPDGKLFQLVERRMGEVVFRGSGIAESSGSDDPVEGEQ